MLLRLLTVTLISLMFACSDDTEKPGIDPEPDTGPDLVDDQDVPDMDLPDVDPNDSPDDMIAEPDLTTDQDLPDIDPPDLPAETFDPLQICLADCNYSGPHWCQVDCDYDGLSNCEEAQLGTDPCNNDTDGDGLGDLEELQVGSDPLNPDSDGDGLNDYDEIYFGFSPTNPSTYNDGILDGDRWIVSACDDLTGEPVTYRTSAAGDWLLALPPAFSNYTELGVSIATAQNALAAAVYDDPANEVSASLLSMRPSPGQTTPNDVLSQIRARVAQTGTILQDQTSGEFVTHDFSRAAISRFLIRVPQLRSVRQTRDTLLFNIAPFNSSDVNGLPVSSGITYQNFRVFVSVTYRSSAINGERLMVAAALAPADKFDQFEKVRFRMDDLTNTTNVTSANDGYWGRCSTFRAGEGNPEADFYWVLDQSGSMYDDYARVRAVANSFFSNLTNTALDYRLAVTTMDRNFFGRPVGTIPWYTDLPTFLAGINNVETGNYNGGLEHGLQSARDGITWMRSSSAPQSARIRPDAQLITIMISDEEDNDFQYQNLTAQPYVSQLAAYTQFFVANTIVFAIVAYTNSRYDDGAAYRHVAFATGGSAADLEATDIQETIDEIIYAATGLASAYVLPATPISSTLRVFKNAEWVPRSRENGFDYFASSNAIAFFGSYRPEPADPTAGRYGDDIAVGYETFLDLTKD